MRGVRRTGTGAEIIVRRLAHRYGYRFRVDRKDLPGRPDIVFPAKRAVIFVHGCFWHRHRACRRASVPHTRTDYWLAKFERNVARDVAAQRELKKLGWRVLVLWECQTQDAKSLAARLRRFLG
jgi:DNA mismatch endonuclease (patch repair protein)